MIQDYASRSLTNFSLDIRNNLPSRKKKKTTISVDVVLLNSSFLNVFSCEHSCQYFNKEYSR